MFRRFELQRTPTLVSNIQVMDFDTLGHETIYGPYVQKNRPRLPNTTRKNPYPKKNPKFVGKCWKNPKPYVNILAIFGPNMAMPECAILSGFRTRLGQGARHPIDEAKGAHDYQTVAEWGQRLAWQSCLVQMSQPLGSQVYSSESLVEGICVAQNVMESGKSREQIKAELEARWSS